MAFGHSRRGFTLIELAVVIAIVGLLLGAILTPLSTQIKVRKNRDAERRLQVASEALVGFAIANGRLPCPDTDRNGIENSPCAAPAAVGFIPWATLDTEPLDPWGRIVLYRVNSEFTLPVATGQPPSTPGQLDITDRGDGRVRTPDLSTKVPTDITQEAPVMLLSTGANGAGGTHLDGTTIAGPAAGTDEAENLNGDRFAVRRTHTPAAAACDDINPGPPPGNPPCEFDDIVAWISGPRLIGMMVQAGQLP